MACYVWIICIVHIYLFCLIHFSLFFIPIYECQQSSLTTRTLFTTKLEHLHETWIIPVQDGLHCAITKQMIPGQTRTDYIVRLHAILSFLITKKQKQNRFILVWGEKLLHLKLIISKILLALKLISKVNMSLKYILHLLDDLFHCGLPPPPPPFFLFINYF